MPLLQISKLLERLLERGSGLQADVGGFLLLLVSLSEAVFCLVLGGSLFFQCGSEAELCSEAERALLRRIREG